MFYLKNRLIEFGEGSSRRELDNKDLVRSKAISVLKPRVFNVVIHEMFQILSIINQHLELLNLNLSDLLQILTY